ncbi:LOW QUALITY PROTEIN: hypothetical protein NC652_040021 [Populus alba x Populus x berolinensis]|nr:LOW QUALITY PROTEIN: hypothetical protein NC652_040018 [Populus alba x Populus x berolinensis]KAJ6863335.1 LOW QUALITY PROTEIN: hypothetical protein NC652_040021 [Populus alba x Populus x berolinensis]
MEQKHIDKGASSLGLFVCSAGFTFSCKTRQGNGIQGRDSDFSQMKSITTLNISGNSFQGSVMGVFQELLEVMDLSKNQFEGHISQVKFNSTYNWSRLVYLDLSDNQLSGGIFHDFSHASNLKYLNLAFNRFTEAEFPRIDMLSELEYLNLSKTSLIGHIPKFSPETFQSHFSGSLDSCPIAANPGLFQRKVNHKGLKLSLGLALSVVFMLAGLLFLAFGCRRKSKMWEAKQTSYKEEQNISGPFSFQTDSTIWVADVKQANSVPVVIFEKPLSNITFADLLSATSNFDRGTLLAEGKFGPVYRGFLPGGIQVAVKVLVHGSTLIDQEAARELEYLGRIKHPNLVPLTDNDSPTPKSDVYCFGVVLFELITGKKPIGDDYAEEKNSTLVSWVRGLVRKSEGSRAIDPKIRNTGPEREMEEALKIGYLCTADLNSKRPSMQQIVGLLKDIEPTSIEEWEGLYSSPKKSAVASGFCWCTTRVIHPVKWMDESMNRTTAEPLMDHGFSVATLHIENKN